jgi:mono/diheme cytochrome c family protein
MRRATAMALGILVGGCAPEQAPAPVTPPPPVTDIDDLPRGVEQNERLCEYLEREDIDSVMRVKFCDGIIPRIESLRDLQRVLDLGCPDLPAETPPDFDPFVAGPIEYPPGYDFPYAQCGIFALSTLSSSVNMKLVSPLNPRALIFGVEQSDSYGYRVMGYTRGDHLVEIITENRNKIVNGHADINFFLIRFEQACTEDDSCTNADLYTERIESDWTGISIYTEEDVANTPLDCLQCHASGAQRALLFHEIERPWPHMMQAFRDDIPAHPPGFADFDSELPNKRAFVDAHGLGGRFAGLPINGIVNNSVPEFVENVIVTRGFGDGFDAGLFTFDPGVQSRLRIHTFEELQAMSLAGEIIQFPTIRSGDLMDPEKRDAAIASVVAFRDGSAEDILDLADVFPEGQEAEYERLSLRVQPGISGAEIITQACSQCHNSRLDQTLSRASFNATTLDEMSAAELTTAQERIMRDLDEDGRMPPPRYRVLYDDERQRAFDYLEELIEAKR